MPTLYRCRRPTCRAIAIRDSSKYSKSNVCGEACYEAFLGERRERAATKPAKPPRDRRPPPEPAPVVVPVVPAVDWVDAIFERARAAVAHLDR